MGIPGIGPTVEIVTGRGGRRKEGEEWEEEGNEEEEKREDDEDHPVRALHLSCLTYSSSKRIPNRWVSKYVRILRKYLDPVRGAGWPGNMESAAEQLGVPTGRTRIRKWGWGGREGSQGNLVKTAPKLRNLV